MKMKIQLVVISVAAALWPLHAAEPESAQPAPDIVGWYFWEQPNAPWQNLAKIFRDANGRLRATTANVARGEKDRLGSAVFYDPPHIRIELEPNAAIRGRLSPDGKKFEAIFQDGDFMFPNDMDRVDSSRFPADPILIFSPGPEGAARLGGYWNGLLEWKGAKLRHVLRIGRAADGRVLGKLDLLDQGERNIPLTGIKLTNSNARIESKPWEFVYSGQLSAAGEQLDMKFECGAKTGTISFNRAAEPWRFALADFTVPAGEAKPGDLAGEWSGIVDYQATYSRLALRIQRTSEGSYRLVQYYPDDPDFIPSPAIVFQHKSHELRCEWLVGDLERTYLAARFDPARQRITGFFQDRWGAPNPVVLERSPAARPSSHDSK